MLPLFRLYDVGLVGITGLTQAPPPGSTPISIFAQGLRS
jgi:hypothetical protein